MKKRFLPMAVLFLFFSCIPDPAQSARIIDDEKGICYESEDRTSVIGKAAAKQRKIVITVDGMHPQSSFNFSAPDLTTLYLYENISKDWREKFYQDDGMIIAFTWSRDTHKTGEAVEKLYEVIKHHNSIKNPVSILSHSWGTVIAYVTLQKHPDIYVENLVTLGSPLSSQTSIVFLFTKSLLSTQGIFSIKKPENAKSWYNHIVNCDPFASNFLELLPNSNFSSREDYGSGMQCHHAYFQSSFLWKTALKHAMGYKVPIYYPKQKIFK